MIAYTGMMLLSRSAHHPFGAAFKDHVKFDDHGDLNNTQNSQTTELSSSFSHSKRYVFMFLTLSICMLMPLHALALTLLG